MTQHATLTPERWSRFDADRQILMIGNEMNRGAQLVEPADRALLCSCYERVLRLVDLTVQVNRKRTLRREILRWRDLIAALYVDARGGSGLQVAAHRAAFRALLQLRPVAARQIPSVLA